MPDNDPFDRRRCVVIAPMGIAMVLILTSCAKADDAAYTREVAAAAKDSCLTERTRPANAAEAHFLNRLCQCEETKILAMNVHEDHPEIDRDEAANDAADRADALCTDELGGIANAEDYRAFNMEPPAP